MANQDWGDRYQHTRVFVDEDTGVQFLGISDPISFIDDRENIMHVITAGDTLEALSDRYYDGFKDPQDLYWVIAQFQPRPIMDPTQQLPSGTVLVLPSPALLNNIVSSPPVFEDNI